MLGTITSNTPGVAFTFEDLNVFVDEDTTYTFANGLQATANDLTDNSLIELFGHTVDEGIVTAIDIIIFER